MLADKEPIQFLLGQELHFFPLPENGIGIRSDEEKFKEYELKLYMSPDRSKMIIEIYRNKNKLRHYSFVKWNWLIN